MSEGRLETRQFTDRQGRERELPHIVANDVQFLGSRRDVGQPEDDVEASVEEVPPEDFTI
jgi:single-stranded DNA-binding protein